MRQSNNFSLFIISDVPYLLPFGQGIADLKRGVQINDTGAYLWKLLDKDRTEDELLALYAAHYETPDSQLPQLRNDLRQFLQILNSYGMLDQTEEQADSKSESDFHTISECETPADSGSISHFDTDPDHGASNIHISACHTHESASFKKDPAENSNTSCTSTVHRYLSIGGLTLMLCGSKNAFSQDFDAFEIFPDTIPADAAGIHSSPADQADSETNNVFHKDQTVTKTNNTLHVDQTVTVINHAPAQHPISKTLLKNRELEIMENNLQYIFLFPNAPGIYEAYLTKDGADARYYCCPPYTESIRQDLFHAIRLSFLYLAQLHDMVVLHSASLLYRDKAWLFSGHSGAGKSTHTNLWKDLYNVPLINGDLNLLSMENGHPVVHGLPWCGTSGIFDTQSYPLGGILLIKKAPQNHVDALDTSHAQLLVAQRLISPNWTETLMRKNLRFVAELAPHILICRLCCTKTPEAAEAGKKAVDNYLLSDAQSLLPFHIF